jgi:hypothetical protein
MSCIGVVITHLISGFRGSTIGSSFRKPPGAQSYAAEILLKLNMTIWNATIYCTPVVRDTVMVSLR